MGEVKHTPGPWAVDEFPDYVDGSDMEVLDANHFPIADVRASPIINRWPERFPEMDHWAAGADDGRTQIYRAQDELLANARLIAAAPDMLAALKMLRDADDMDVREGVSGTMGPEQRGIVDAVLAAAEGR